jgi:arginase
MFSGLSLRIIGVPFGLGGLRKGANLGPDAMRLAGITDQLRPYVADLQDLGDVSGVWDSGAVERGEGIGFFEHVLTNMVLVRQALSRNLGPGLLPVVLGGDHSVELATIPTAYERYGDELGVLWIDAHADYNTPSTSPSGNLHGMVLAGVCGLPSGTTGTVDNQWERLKEAVAPAGTFLPHHNIQWIGLREVDAGEAKLIASGDLSQASTMHEIDRYGIAAVAQTSIKRLAKAGVTKLWVSFDADVLDPMIAPGTGTHVRGGLTYREAHLLAEMLHESFRENSSMELVGLKIAEVNPILDQQNSTAMLCVEWVASLLGKRILPIS